MEVPPSKPGGALPTRATSWRRSELGATSDLRLWKFSSKLQSAKQALQHNIDQCAISRQYKPKTTMRPRTTRDDQGASGASYLADKIERRRECAISATPGTGYGDG